MEYMDYVCFQIYMFVFFYVVDSHFILLHCEMETTFFVVGYSK